MCHVPGNIAVLTHLGNATEVYTTLLLTMSPAPHITSLAEVSQLRSRVVELEKQLAGAEHRQLERSSCLNRLLIDTAQEMMFTIDPEGRFFDVNTTACKRLGYGREELLSMRVWDVDPNFTPEIWPRRWEVTRKKHRHTFESTHRDRIGRLIPVEISVSFVEFEDTEFACVFARDISPRQQAEQRDRKHREEMSHVAQLAMIGIMTSQLAHEINQPLFAIGNYSEACASMLSSSDTLKLKQVEKWIREIQIQTSRAGDIIRKVTRSGQQGNTVRTALDVNAMLKEIVQAATAQASFQETKLRIALTDNLPMVRTDPLLLKQAITYLVDNSLEVVAEQGNLGEIELGSRLSDDEEVELVVRDNGPGIQTDLLAQVFQPCFSTKPTGSGLGLTISRAIIQAHGGRLWIESSEPGNTTFVLSLLRFSV